MTGEYRPLLRERFGPICAALFAFLFAAGLPAAPERWLRGNTHAHTILCGHGDSTPEVAARWYLDNGYNFLVLSEHNHYIEPRRVRLPPGRRRDFLLIPGQEVTQAAGFGSQVVHVTGMGTRGLVDWAAPKLAPSVLIQTYLDRVRARGGLAILNHPNLSWSLGAQDILPVKGLSFIELYNAHPQAANSGDGKHVSTEVLWDAVLSQGRRLYGVAADDAHLFRDSAPGHPNPGRAWIMVRSQKLSLWAIKSAMARGNFYASTGVTLSRLQVSPGRYTVAVDRRRTDSGIGRGLFGDPTTRTAPSARIEFFGSGGRLLKSVTGERASFHFDRRELYVRAKVTLVRRVPVGYREHAFREFYAWTQPIFGPGTGRQ